MRARKISFLPGSHIPIVSPVELENNRPDYLLILPWNIAEEVTRFYGNLAESGTLFVTAVPELKFI
jgi:hypothetical protein